MKKTLFIILKAIGVLLVLLLILSGIVYYTSINYDMPSLHAETLAAKYGNTDVDTQALAEALVKEMTLEEKIDQMYGEKRSQAPKFLVNILGKNRFPHVYVGENERLNIPPWVLSDGPRGARVMDKSINGVTTFPVAMARGASWDIDLEYRIHEVIAIEMRANKVNYAATPCINLLRHPAWGRAQETYGEDPWHLGEFGVAAVKAIESHNVMACPKHFALNSIDNSRWVVDVQVDERTLREVYLPHFKKTIQEGEPASIMSAYNAVRGEFCGSNKELLTDILRDDWGFEGFVSTDWVFGLYDGVGGIKAGLDVEMPWQNAYGYDEIKDGIAQGEITEQDLDKIVTRSLATRLKYALIDDQHQYPQTMIGQQASIDLARQAAEESMVLLKNESVLPFSKKTGKTIAVIGSIADIENTGDQGSSNSTPIHVTTPYEGIKAYHQRLGNEVILADGSDLSAAKAIAEEADEVILVVGFTFEDEGEYIIFSRDEMEKSAELGKPAETYGVGGDREDLSLLAKDEQLIQALAGSNTNMVVVYIGGSAIDMSPWEDQVPAILFAWYAGMEGGSALANILYGEVNPSGKLPFTIAQNQSDYPYFTPFTKQITYDYYHGYTLFDKEQITPAYPFGFGLSYTSFQYDSLSVTHESITADSTLIVDVDVTNTGYMTGKEVVQLYIGFENATVDRPIKLLRDFEKVELNASETKTVRLEVDAKDLAWYNPEINEWVIDAMEYEVYVGSSSATKDLLKGAFTIN